MGKGAHGLQATRGQESKPPHDHDLQFIPMRSRMLNRLKA